MNDNERTQRTAWRSALSALVVALGLGMAPIAAHALIACGEPLPIGPDGQPGSGDFDQDGFTDAQECGTGIPLDLGTVVSPAVVTDPNRVDVFVVVGNAGTASLLPQGYRPFEPITAYGLNFNGLAALGVTVHQLTGAQVKFAPGQPDDRQISSLSPQKAVRISESPDTNGSILGHCSWGTPMGPDGCVLYTRRIKNFIDETCNSAGDTTTDRNQVFLAYVTQSVLHEVGHTLGGLAAEFNSRFGGYHYKTGAGFIMEQAVYYTTKNGKCTFFISPGWNVTLDPPAVKLK